MTLAELVADTERQLTHAGVSFGHGTTNARDEAAWLVLHALGLPLDIDIDGSAGKQPAAPDGQARAATLLKARIDTRQPLAYLLKEAWLQGVPFYVDERAIVPRSLIAEVLADGSIDPWLSGLSAPARARLFQQLADQGATNEFEVLWQGAESRNWALLSARRLLYQAQDAVLTTFTPINSLKAMEERLALWAKVFEASSESIMITDGERRIITVNRAFSRSTGYSFEEIAGQTPCAEHVATLWPPTRTSKPVTDGYEVCAAPGSTRSVRLPSA